MDKNTDLNGYYHDGGVTKRQMRGFAFFAEKFADPEFELGHFQATPVVKNGPRKPIFILSDMANDFVTYCINERVVDLRIEPDAQVNWGKFTIGGAKSLTDATAFDLVPLITHVLGNEIHWQSRLINAFQTGVLQQILNRGAELAYPEDLTA